MIACNWYFVALFHLCAQLGNNYYDFNAHEPEQGLDLTDSVAVAKLSKEDAQVEEEKNTIHQYWKDACEWNDTNLAILSSLIDAVQLTVRKIGILDCQLQLNEHKTSKQLVQLNRYACFDSYQPEKQAVLSANWHSNVLPRHEKVSHDTVKSNACALKYHSKAKGNFALIMKHWISISSRAQLVPLPNLLTMQPPSSSSSTSTSSSAALSFTSICKSAEDEKKMKATFDEQMAHNASELTKDEHDWLMEVTAEQTDISTTALSYSMLVLLLKCLFALLCFCCC